MKKYVTLLLGLLLTIIGCSDQSLTEHTGESQQQLSSSANLVFSISDMYLSNSGWGDNGTVFCDAQNRCVSDHTSNSTAGVGVIHFTNLAACPHLISATLNFSTTEWDSVVPKAEVRRFLRTITIPSACPSATSMSNTHVGWRYASNGVAWTQLGAHGVGTDVSNENVSVSVGYGSNLAHSVDVTSIVDPCIGSGTCDLAMFSVLDSGQSLPSHHFWLIVGSPTLVFTCDEGGSTSSTGGGSTTTSSAGSGGVGGSGGSCN